MRRVLALLLVACGSEPIATLDEPAIPDVAGMLPELTYYVRTADGAAFGGFDGALSAAIDGITPDEHGRFRVELPPDPTMQLSNGLSYRLREQDAIEQAVRPALSGAGSLPNDLLIAGSGADAYGVLVRSGDSGVSVVDLSRGLSESGVRIDGHPFFAGIVDGEARRIAVSDYEGDEVHLIDLASGTVERTLSPPEIALDEPFALPRPFDVDGNGTMESQVTQFRARSPQSVIRAGDRLIAGYSGFAERRLDEERGSVFLPGVLASWSLSDLDAVPRVLVLPALNPQELRVLDDQRIIVVCSGHLEPSGGARALTEGAITFVDPDALAIVEEIRMGDFAPGTALMAADRIVVASLVKARVRIIGGMEIAVNEEAIDSIFRLVDLGGGLVGVPSYNTDRLHILDARTGELDPEPFFAPLSIGPGRPLFDGLQIVAARPGRRGIDFTGPDLMALTGQASELVPIELRKVLGP